MRSPRRPTRSKLPSARPEGQNRSPTDDPDEGLGVDRPGADGLGVDGLGVDGLGADGLDVDGVGVPMVDGPDVLGSVPPDEGDAGISIGTVVSGMLGPVGSGDAPVGVSPAVPDDGIGRSIPCE